MLSYKLIMITILQSIVLLQLQKLLLITWEVWQELGQKEEAVFQAVILLVNSRTMLTLQEISLSGNKLI